MYLILSFILLIANISAMSILFKKRMFASLLTPAIYCFVSVYSFVGIFIFDYALKVPFDFFDSYSKDEIYDAISIFLCAALILSTSSIFSTLFAKRSITLGANSRFDLIVYLREKYQTISNSKLVLISLLSSFFLVCAVGPYSIFINHGYMGHESVLFLKLYTFSLPISSFAISIIRKRYLRYTLFIFVLIIIFSTSSRSILILPFVYILGSVIRHNRFVLIKAFILVCLAIILSSIALEYRSHPIQGVLGNGSYLLTNGFNLDYISLGLNYLFSYSVSLLTFMINEVNYDSAIFWLSINPLPGFMLDLTLIVENAKANVFAPYSTIGEVYLMGGLCFTIFYSIIGYTIGSVEYKSSNNAIIIAIVFILTLLFAFLSLQYNVRGSIRFIYLVILLNIFISLHSFLRKYYHR